MQRSKNAIALLITVMFVIVITVAIGISLKQINLATQEVKDETFMYQSSIIIEDVLKILHDSPELKAVTDSNSSLDLYTFLAEAAYIPFNSSGIEIVLEVKSARGKFNPKQLNAVRADRLREYLSYKSINSEYVNLLLDSVSGVKIDNSYNSALFDTHPSLFRDFIASKEHLEVINDFYTKEYNDNALKNVDFDTLFYYGDTNTTIDVNYASAELWELMTGVNKERAETLFAGGGSYENDEALGLSETELSRLKEFNYTFHEPYLFVNIAILRDNSRAKITFEYDVKKNKGSNFVYDI